MQRLVFLPDTQFPYEDKQMWAALVRFVGDYQPDHVYQVGDLTDQPETGRWNRGSRGEYAGTLQASMDYTQARLAELRAVYDGPITVKFGNHDIRLSRYVAQYAPALASLRGVKLERLLDLEGHRVGWSYGVIPVAPGWVVAHGDEGSLRNYGGGTALALAEKLGRSVVCGHSHRAGITSRWTSVNGRVTGRLTGLEVGHVMDLRRADYIKAGSANWQTAFGLLTVDGGRVTPSLVHIHPGGRFVVDGKAYQP